MNYSNLLISLYSFFFFCIIVTTHPHTSEIESQSNGRHSYLHPDWSIHIQYSQSYITYFTLIARPKSLLNGRECSNHVIVPLILTPLPPSKCYSFAVFLLPLGRAGTGLSEAGEFIYFYYHKFKKVMHKH